MLSRRRDYIDFLILGRVIHNPVFSVGARKVRARIRQIQFVRSLSCNIPTIFKYVPCLIRFCIESKMLEKRYHCNSIDCKRLFSLKGELSERVRATGGCINVRKRFVPRVSSILAPTSSLLLQHFENWRISFLPLIPFFLCQVLYMFALSHMTNVICQ